MEAIDIMLDRWIFNSIIRAEIRVLIVKEINKIKEIKVMKTFENIEWKKHQLGPGFIQGLLMLDSGIELSVVAGSGMYCSSKAGTCKPVDIMKIDEILSFEVAIFNDGSFLEEMDDQVLGWQSREDINELIKKHS